MPASRGSRLGRGSNGSSQLDTPIYHPELSNEANFELSNVRVSQVHSGSEKLRPLSAIASARTGTEDVVRMIINARAKRRKFVPAHLLADPAWDMLLDLYLADVLSKRINVSSLCVASNVPATTALRWIAALDKEGLITRTSDPVDARRYFISLSDAGLVRMDGYFESIHLCGVGR